MRLTAVIWVAQVKAERWPVGPETLAIVDHLRTYGWGSVPPIRVRKNGAGQFIIKDGRHRLAAYKLLGWLTIPARYHTHVKIKARPCSYLNIPESPGPQADGYSQEG